MQDFTIVCLSVSKEFMDEFYYALTYGVWRSGKPLTAKQKQVCVEAITIHHTHILANIDAKRFAHIGRIEAHLEKLPYASPIKTSPIKKVSQS